MKTWIQSHPSNQRHIIDTMLLQPSGSVGRVRGTFTRMTKSCAITPASSHICPSSRRYQGCITESRSYHRRAPLPKAFHGKQYRRSASTEATPLSANPTGTTAPASVPLDWNTFFQLRKTRRYFQLGSSVTSSAASFLAGAQVMTQVNMDTVLSWIPADPFIAMGLITFLCGGAGWLAGPVVGTAMFNIKNRKHGSEMADKEREFYRRIKKWRVDPAGASVANPVPGTSQVNSSLR